MMSQKLDATVTKRKINSIEHVRASALMFIIFMFIVPMTNSGEVYKWIDESGKIHYGDKSAAPNGSEKLGIKESDVDSAQSLRSTQDHLNDSRFRSATRIPGPTPPASMPAFERVEIINPNSVGTSCQTLIDKILAAQRKQVAWEGFAEQFIRKCPGIAYSCREYPKHPQKNTCQWIKSDGSSFLQVRVADENAKAAK
jgi:hypothetical protein